MPHHDEEVKVEAPLKEGKWVVEETPVARLKKAQEGDHHSEETEGKHMQTQALI